MADETPESEREIVVSRVIEGPRALVFEVFTDVKHLSHWWGPDGFTTTTRRFDFRPGGGWEFVMHGPDGKDYDNCIEYLEIVPPARIVQRTGRYPGDPAAFQSIITFVEQGRQTEVTLRAVFRTKALRDQAVEQFHAIEGGRQTLGKLAAYVETLTTSEGR